MNFQNFIIFTGNSNYDLANKVAKKINIPLGISNVSKFSDGEIIVEINENVRGKNIFILQSISAPSNDNFMEIILMIDALKRASAKNIIAVIPYFGYARQDRRIRSFRTAISAKVVANILEKSGISRILSIDLHSEQMQGFFNIPIDNLYASQIFLKDLLSKNYKKYSIVSPDIGAISRARFFANKLNCNLVIIDKYRNKINNLKIMNIIGTVKNLDCIIIDDIIDTAKTITKVANILKNNGANKVIAYCTHPVLSNISVKLIESSSLDELIVTDTILLSNSAKSCTKIRQLTCSNLLVKSLKRIILNKSIISLFT